MELSTDLIIIMFLIINVQTGFIISLLDSRNFYKRKLEEEMNEKC